MKYPVFDLHCDTALELLDNSLRRKCRLYERQGHIDLKRGLALSGYAQQFAFFTTTDMDPNGKFTPEQIFDAMLQNFQDELKVNAQWMEQARTSQDAERIVKSGKVAAILTLEGPAGIGFDVGRLDELAELGFAMTTLTWNEKNPLAGSHATGGGLTEKGKEYVRKAQHLGMAIDVSHLGEEAFWGIMNITQAPVSASHSDSRKVCGVSRNLTDEQFKAICETGGVVGLNLYSAFLGEGQVDLDTACNHILHWLELGGEKHISLGGDLDGCGQLPDGFTGIESYPALAEALENRGVSQAVIEDLYWNNAMRMWSKCCM